MQFGLALGYKNRSQIARVVTEAWAAENLFCARCEAPQLQRARTNTPAIDLGCDDCKAVYQLKSGMKWSEDRILDAAYQSMVAAIRSDRVPNLFVMQYDSDWKVLNLLLVPSFFFSESSIEKRKPLGPGARRAGWVGCNILLKSIAPEGRLRIVVDGVPRSPKEVRSDYQSVQPLASLKAELRGWTLDVLTQIHRLGKTRFSLSDVYELEPNLAKLHPNNRNVRPKIRQQLQVLRDFGLLKFLGQGEYVLRT
jgi:type II restriction enzyme